MQTRLKRLVVLLMVSLGIGFGTPTIATAATSSQTEMGITFTASRQATVETVAADDHIPDGSQPAPITATKVASAKATSAKATTPKQVTAAIQDTLTKGRLPQTGAHQNYLWQILGLMGLLCLCLGWLLLQEVRQVERSESR